MKIASNIYIYTRTQRVLLKQIAVMENDEQHKNSLSGPDVEINKNEK